MRIVWAGGLAACAACGSFGTPAQTPETAVFDPATSMIELEMSGSLEPTPGAGSTCFPGQASYTYVVATAALTWSFCTAPTPHGVYNPVPGQATLTAAQSTDLLGALRMLQLPEQPCASDTHEQYTFTTPQGAEIYDNGVCLVGNNAVVDAFYGGTQ